MFRDGGKNTNGLNDSNVAQSQSSVDESLFPDQHKLTVPDSKVPSDSNSESNSTPVETPSPSDVTINSVKNDGDSSPVRSEIIIPTEMMVQIQDEIVILHKLIYSAIYKWNEWSSKKDEVLSIDSRELNRDHSVLSGSSLNSSGKSSCETGRDHAVDLQMSKNVSTTAKNQSTRSDVSRSVSPCKTIVCKDVEENVSSVNCLGDDTVETLVKELQLACNKYESRNNMINDLMINLSYLHDSLPNNGCVSPSQVKNRENVIDRDRKSSSEPPKQNVIEIPKKSEDVDEESPVNEIVVEEIPSEEENLHVVEVARECTEDMSLTVSPKRSSIKKTESKSFIDKIFSSSNSLEVESPFQESFHYDGMPHLSVPVCVHRDMPSSIIAHVLASKMYHNKLKAMLTDGCPTSLHQSFSWIDNGAFTCTVYFSAGFHRLRRLLLPEGGEELFVRSLSSSANWATKGGKSKVSFSKTSDDRFVLKDLKSTSQEPFDTFCPKYFDYIEKAHREKRPSALARIFGIYCVSYSKRTRSSAPTNPTSVSLNNANIPGKMFIVMENLMYGHKTSKMYDLKGNTSNRMTKESDHAAPDEVYLDNNLIQHRNTHPILLHPSSAGIFCC